MSKKVPRNREDSVINSLGNFIEVSRNHGVSDEIIYKLLKSRGWSTQDIESAFAIVIEKSVGFSIPSPSQPSGESSREAFLYLLSFVTIVKCEEKKLEEKHLGSKHGKTPRCFSVGRRKGIRL